MGDEERAETARMGATGSPQETAMGLGTRHDDSEITLYLRQMRDGDRDAESQLYELLLPLLRHMAEGAMRGQPANHTLQATALVNEA